MLPSCQTPRSSPPRRPPLTNRTMHDAAGMSCWTNTRRPTRKDWDLHRPTIERLYLQEQKTLEEVMAIMANDYDLHGTIRMYKARVEEWRMYKNNAKRDMLAILRKKRERDAVGKSSAFKVRGRPVDVQDAMQYYCRKKGRGGCVSPLLSLGAPPTPPDVSCWTPVPSSPPSPRRETEGRPSLPNSPQPDLHSIGISRPGLHTEFYQSRPDHVASLPSWNFSSSPLHSAAISRPISPPASLLLPEQLFAVIRSYIQSSFSGRTWISDAQGQLINVRANPNAPKNPGDIVAQCFNVAKFFEKQSFVECRQAMSKVFALIQDLLTTEDPRTLESFLASLVFLTKLRMQDIASMLRRYISEMAAAVLPRCHPWREVCRLIGLPDAHEFELLLDRSYHCVVDTFEHELGPFHKQALTCRVEAIHSLYTRTDAVRAELQLRKLLSDCSGFCGASDWRSQYIMVSLGWNLNIQGRYAEAEAMGAYALQCAALDSSDSKMVIRRMELIGDCQYHQAKIDAAERSIRDTIDIITSTRGRADPWAIENMIRLERWLREWGREDEAARLKDDIKELLSLES